MITQTNKELYDNIYDHYAMDSEYASLIEQNGELLLEAIRNTKNINLKTYCHLQQSGKLFVLLGVTQIINNKNPMYFLTRAIELEEKLGYFYLAVYYKSIDNAFEAHKVFITAFEKGVTCACWHIATFYKETKNFEEMHKYYKIGADNKIPMAIYDYATYYKKNNDLNNMLKYFTLLYDINIDHKPLIIYDILHCSLKLSNVEIFKKYFEKSFSSLKSINGEEMESILFSTNHYHNGETRLIIANIYSDHDPIVNYETFSIFFKFYYHKLSIDLKKKYSKELKKIVKTYIQLIKQKLK